MVRVITLALVLSNSTENRFTINWFQLTVHYSLWLFWWLPLRLSKRPSPSPRPCVQPFQVHADNRTPLLKIKVHFFTDHLPHHKNQTMFPWNVWSALLECQGGREHSLGQHTSERKETEFKYKTCPFRLNKVIVLSNTTTTSSVLSANGLRRP